ncbi:MAG: hypothetical protein U0746_09850 [Gemmataceae bacterium]
MKRTSLQVEGLETRDNPSVSVGIAISGGSTDLYVTGDAASDQVQLQRLPNGAIRIQGLNGTKVNGVASVDRFFNDDLFINLGAGNNYLSVLDTNGGITADFVDIKTGNGADTISIQRLNVLDDIFVDTNDGSDYVYLNRVTASNRVDGPGDDGINIYTRGGADTVVLNNSTSAEDVVVILDSSDAGAPGFNDNLFADNVRATDDFFLYGFGGNDSMRLNNLTAGDVLSATLGSGNDFLKLTNSHARTISTHGEAGTDTLQYYNDSYTSWNYTGFETYVNGP